MASDSVTAFQVVSASIAFASAIGACLSAWLVLRSEKRKRRLEMHRECNNLVDDRRTIWAQLRVVYEAIRQQKSNQPSLEQLNTLEDTILAFGAPPNIVKRKGRPLSLWGKENERELSPEQRILWKLALRVYPPAQDSTIITGSTAREFDESRNRLAWFWDAWVPFMKMRYLTKRYKSSGAEVIILAWLEAALAQKIGGYGEGKTELFKLAGKFGKKVRDNL